MLRLSLHALSVVALCAAVTGALPAAPAAAVVPATAADAAGWTVDGTVNAMARRGDTAYLGGSFSLVQRAVPGLAALDAAGAGDLAGAQPQLPAATIAVTATVAATDGGMFVASSGADAAGVTTYRVDRFNADGAPVPDFIPLRFDGAVTRLVVSGNAIFAAGSFTTVVTRARMGLSSFNATTGELRGWAPATNGAVTDLQLGDGVVYVGGRFTQIGGADRSRVAALTLDTGAATAWAPEPDGAVNAIAVSGQTVYLGGTFTTLAGGARHGLGAVSASAPGTLKAFDPSPDGFITTPGALAVGGTTVYVAGTFTHIGAGTAAARRGVAAVDADTGAATAWDAQASVAPQRLLAAGGLVYLGFPYASAVTVGGQPRCGLAAVDGATGAPQDWDPSVADRSGLTCRDQGSPRVDVLTTAGDRVLAGGDVHYLGQRARSSLAAIDVATGELLPWSPAVTGGLALVRALAISPGGTTAFVGGDFQKLDGVNRLNAGAVSATGTASTAAAVTSWDVFPNNSVRSLAITPDGTRVYVGGSFTTIGGRSRNRLAATAPTGTTIDTTWLPQPDGTIRDLALAADGRLFAAGTFSHIAGQARVGVAAIDPEAGTPSAFDAGLPSGSFVFGLVLHDDRVTIGGTFATVAGQPRPNAADLDAVTGEPSAWAPAPDGRVLRVAVDGADGTVYLAGTFTNVAGTRRRGLAAVTAAGTLSDWDPQADTQTEDPSPAGVLVLSDALLVGGSFTTTGGEAHRGLARFGSAPAPRSVTAPTLKGTGVIGAQLTCRPGTWTVAGTSTITWLRDGATIAAATGKDYIVVAGDLDHAVGCRETLANAAGSASADSPALAIMLSAPELQAAPAVAGDPWPGGVARCSSGLWSGAPEAYDYRWLLDGVGLDGATAADHAVVAGEQGHQLACAVVARNAGGTSAPALSSAVAVTEPPPARGSAVRVIGDAVVGQTLTCDPGTWTGARTFSSAWLRGEHVIEGGNALTYVAQARDIGQALSCVLTISGPGGSVTVRTAAVVIAPAAHTATILRPITVPMLTGSSAATVRLTARGALAPSGHAVVVQLDASVTGSVIVQLRLGTTVLRRTVGVVGGHAKRVTVALGSKMRRRVRAAGTKGVSAALRATLTPNSTIGHITRTATLRLRTSGHGAKQAVT
jgi:hypothetical protein